MPKLFAGVAHPPPAQAPAAAGQEDPTTPIPSGIENPPKCTTSSYDAALDVTYVNYYDGKRHRHYVYGGRLGFICGASLPALVVLEHLVSDWKAARPNLGLQDLDAWEDAIMDVVLTADADARISRAYREYFRRMLMWTHCTSCLWWYLSHHVNGSVAEGGGQEPVPLRDLPPPPCARGDE